MAECNTCGGYLSIEDKIRLSMKCDANGNVVWQGALLNQIEPELPANYWQENDTENYFLEEETDNILTLEDL